ncbi:MAG: hypothetical protein KC474_11750, partial [Cyanobacteria bacterium HKST-UBA04]|nr:hypothetical protein [Cyanobacteria bacterium HKST-UBA04]
LLDTMPVRVPGARPFDRPVLNPRGHFEVGTKKIQQAPTGLSGLGNIHTPFKGNVQYNEARPPAQFPLQGLSKKLGSP